MSRVQKRRFSEEEELLIQPEIQLRTRGGNQEQAIRPILQTNNNNQFLSTLARYDFLTHEVQPGETLAGISLRYNCKLPLLKQANNLSTEIQLAALPYIRVPVPRNSLQTGQLVDISAKVEIQREAILKDELCPQRYMNDVDERLKEIHRSLPETKESSDSLLFTASVRPPKPSTCLTSTTLMIICLVFVCVGLPILYTVYILTNPLHGDVFQLLPS